MCSRVTYLSPGGLVLVGRSADWMIPTHSDFWVLPRGLTRSGEAAENSLQWSSRFGSLSVIAMGGVVVEGLNSEGLCANLLYLDGSDYGVRDVSRPGLSLGGWVQYLLDNFATVSDAVSSLKSEPFQIVAPHLPGGFSPVGHVAITDKSGDSAIFEYIAGRLEIHHGRDYKVVTNEPRFDEQLALVRYWNEIGGSMLPGTERPADRFIRASYYLERLELTENPERAAAEALSVVRNVSVPFLAEPSPEAPNVAPTLWRSIVDLGAMRYFFEDALSPSIFWVDFAELNVQEGAPVLMLEAENGPIRFGEVSAQLSSGKAQPFLAEAVPM